jgi:hypothetical protein
MAASKPRRRAPHPVSGGPVADPILRQPRPKTGNPSWESRVSALERKVSRLKTERETARGTSQPWWQVIT